MNEPVTYEELYHSLPNGLLETRSGDFTTYDRMDPTKYGLNPLGKKIGQFMSGGLSAVPPSVLTFLSNSSDFKTMSASSDKKSSSNASLSSIAPIKPGPATAHKAAADLIVNSDLIFYGVVKEEASDISIVEKTDSDSTIQSTVVFKIEEPVKGPARGDVNVSVYAGNYDGAVLYLTNDLEMPTVWDFKEGDRYLLYLKESGDSYEIMYGGLYSIV
ncbi:hypothetical protein [Methanolapillus millepedarum]|uniref:Uncharacterized protein n=1 Tax=Methanolapillus millepedarum TaxID=3028296 RepID=A0AA96ZVV4_9EURY|nr:hypothetical protein MsAc7_14460 [Methanosarcinaceae archaeon Ac7]